MGKRCGILMFLFLFGIFFGIHAAPVRAGDAEATVQCGDAAAMVQSEDAVLLEELNPSKEQFDVVETKEATPGEIPLSEEEGKFGDKILEGRFGSLSVHGSLVGYYHGTTTANIEGEDMQGQGNTGYVANLTLGWKPIESGEFTVRLHAGEGDGGDRLLVERRGALLADLNTLNDDNPAGNHIVDLLEAYYTQQLLDGALAVSVGKAQSVSYIDQNAFANNEIAQFVGKPFVNDPVLSSENEYGPLLAIDVKPVPELVLTALVASTSRQQQEDPDKQKEVFDNMLDTPFVAGQIAYSPKLLGLDGTYRAYGWSATYKRAELADENDDPSASRSEHSGWGVGLSFDQKVTEVIGLFARVGYHDKSVYATPWTWAVGTSLEGLIPDRDKDTLGIGVAGLSPTEGKIVDDRTLGGSMEYHLEAFYRIALTDHFYLTPDLQYVVNPLGRTDNDGVLAGMLRAEFSF